MKLNIQELKDEIASIKSSLSIVLITDLLLNVFVLTRSFYMHNEGSAFVSFKLGGSIEDLALIGFARILFYLGGLFMLKCFSTNGKSRGMKLETILAISNIMICLGVWTYVLVKMLIRLVETQQTENGEPLWHPNVEWFWVSMLGACTLATIEMKKYTSFLTKFLILRVEGGLSTSTVDTSLDENLLSNAENGGDPDYVNMTPRQRARNVENDKSLFGSTFDWFYGRIDGKNAEEEQGAAETKDEFSNIEGEEVNVILEMCKMAKPFWKHFIVASFALIFAAIGTAVIPKLTGDIISTVTESVSDDPEEADRLLKQSVGKLLLAGLFTAVFSALRGSCFTVAKGYVNMALREKLLKSLLNQEIGFFDTANSGKLNSRLNTDTTVLSDQISLSVNVFTRSILQAICVLIFMCNINVELSLATFLTVPAVAVITQLYGDLIWHLYNEAQGRLANANMISDAALGSMQNVRCFASENSELTRYHNKMSLYMTLQLRMGFCYTVYAVIFTLLPCVATAVVLFYGGKLVASNSIKSGDLVSFMLYQQNLSAAVNDIGQVFSDLAGALGAGDKVFELINRKPQQVPKGNAKPEIFDGTIEFKDVKFKYPARPDTQILNGVSLKIQPGQVVALTGESGGGKSSILKLVERLYDAESGQITIGGRDIQEYDHEYLHEKITIVSQEPVLYARTIAENIAYGLEGTPQEPTMEQIIKAAKEANAHDFICGFEDGYATMCGDRGTVLSGGQKQRIAIARALVRSGDILLLDEATSALDSESETIVQAALDDLMARTNRTCLVVAHRLSSIVNADVIVAMSKGQIVEQGNHQELLKKKGLYSRLVEKQMAGLN